MKKIMIVLFSILSFAIFIGCSNNEIKTKQVIDIVKEKTNINIPLDAILMEKYETPLFIHGTLPHYYIFCFDQEPKEFLFDNTFQDIKNDEIEQIIINKLKMSNKKHKLKIPEDSLIKFDELYLFIYREDDYCLIYYPNDYKLIVYIMPQ